MNPNNPNTTTSLPAPHTNAACLNCGYCPHCGRGATPLYPNYPTYPVYPTYPLPWYQPSITWCSARFETSGYVKTV